MRSKYLSEEYCPMTDGGWSPPVPTRQPFVINVDNSEVDSLQGTYSSNCFSCLTPNVLG